MEALTLRQMRRVKELSQEHLAEMVHVHVNTLQKWEKNPGKIPIDKARELASVLGASLDEITFK